MNVRIKCWNINWDTDGRGQCGLPSEVELEFDVLWWEENVHDDADEEAAVFGELTDKYGFKVFSCEYTRV